ncbi:MAG TPA: Yip1 family protein [Candidatus Nanoarchaeia archaeon]|nr:Yip1 family protein [Candidatus Nanoarchaeia archaeon]
MNEENKSKTTKSSFVSLFFKRLKGFFLSKSDFYDEIKKESLEDAAKFWILPLIFYAFLNAFISPLSLYFQMNATFLKNSPMAILFSPPALFIITLIGFWINVAGYSFFVWLGAKIVKPLASFKEIYKYMLYALGFTAIFEYAFILIDIAAFSAFDFFGLLLSIVPKIIVGLFALYLVVTAISRLLTISKMRAFAIYIVGAIFAIIAIMILAFLFGAMFFGILYPNYSNISEQPELNKPEFTSYVQQIKETTMPTEINLKSVIDSNNAKYCNEFDYNNSTGDYVDRIQCLAYFGVINSQEDASSEDVCKFFSSISDNWWCRTSVERWKIAIEWCNNNAEKCITYDDLKKIYDSGFEHNKLKNSGLALVLPKNMGDVANTRLDLAKSYLKKIYGLEEGVSITQIVGEGIDCNSENLILGGKTVVAFGTEKTNSIFKCFSTEPINGIEYNVIRNYHSWGNSRESFVVLYVNYDDNESRYDGIDTFIIELSETWMWS